MPLSTAGVAPTDFPSGWYWRTKWVVHAIVSLLFVTLLWRAGYPEWRTTAIAVLLFSNLVRNLVFKHLVIPVRAVFRLRSRLDARRAHWTPDG